MKVKQLRLLAKQRVIWLTKVNFNNLLLHFILALFADLTLKGVGALIHAGLAWWV
jgi:hypothetical protein